MIFVIFIQLLFSLTVSHAELAPLRSNKPLYELGVVGGAGFIPDYPASDEGRIRTIVVPQFRYRGLRLRSDEEDNMKARLLFNNTYGFDLSGSGAFSSKSDKNEARKGMNDLDWVLELGPRFYYFFVRTNQLWVRAFLPVRAAFSSDLTSATYQGLVFAPAINLRYYFDDSKFNSLIFVITRTYTTHHLQEYYFNVDERYVTPTRPRYKAVSGYMSTNSALAYIYEKGQLGVYSGFGVSSFKGSANAGSPLHRAEYTFAAFFGVSYLFYQSEERGYQ